MRVLIFSILTLLCANADNGFLINMDSFGVNKSSEVVIKWEEKPINQSKAIAQIVEAAANDGGVDSLLALSVAKVESDFNPVAVSSSNAVGVMQLKMETAVRDIYRVMYNKTVLPPAELLFDPQENAKLGVAYLSLLQKKYFKDVENQDKLEYCTIAAYNAGPGAVLRTFHPNSAEAIKVINALTKEEVLKHLLVDLQSEQGRRYVVKVLEAKKSYLLMLRTKTNSSVLAART